ncbi:MAG: homoserine kinase [Solobacterium sp.]|nr:homoserine kinase [Solobacterium sp.]
MVKIRIPASTSNLGPGFDCLGLAFSIYNTFDISLSDHDELVNVEEQYNNPDNLFLKAYHAAGQYCGHDDHFRAVFDCSIPVSRGLGSSASLTCGGVSAYALLHEGKLSAREALELCTKLEGHPDNAAPALFGGLTASINEASVITQKMPLSPDWIYTLYIPDVEVSTAEARRALPDTYSRQIAVTNSAHAILLAKALADGDLELLKTASVDHIHEPYRKAFIPHFDEVKALAAADTDGVFLISGSGSTCISISRRHLGESVRNALAAFDEKWYITETEPAFQGAGYLEEGTWHPIF